MLTLAAGVVCKITLNAVLVSQPGINIHGAPIASLTCYTVSMVPNLYYACKYTGYRFSVLDVVLRPLGAAALMGGAVYAVYTFVFGGEHCLHQSGFVSRAVPVLIMVAVGMIVYLLAAFLLKAIKTDDLGVLRRRKKA